MSVFGVKLPDVGEGVAEAELIAWLVAVGDVVTSESVLAEVMTDKATVEISSPVSGVVTFLRGEPGETVAVGTEFVGIELADDAAQPEPSPSVSPEPSPSLEPSLEPPLSAESDSAPEPLRPASPPAHAVAAPAVRARARSLGIDLATVVGSGPDGRVSHLDLDRHLGGSAGTARTVATDDPNVESIRGLRRRIADRLTSSWTQIPHITYVEAVDATELEILRAELNRRAPADGQRLTMLPFLVRAIVIACGEQPRLNAHYDGAAQSLSMFDPVHIGVATQTADGLMVPVVRHADSLDLWGLAAEIARVANAARSGKATSHELSGSTITVTSLGAMGGLVTTPIINQPEVAIVGVNKLETRPVWRNGSFEPRQLCNLSSSFDHRIVDGWDAATFVQRIKTLMEMPALLFIDDAGAR